MIQTLQHIVPFTQAGASEIAGDPPPPIAAGYMTPDSLMAYCSVRLQGLDSQMKSMFDNEQKSVNDSQTVNDFMAALNNCSGKGLNLVDNHAGVDLLAAAQNAIDKVGPETATGQRLIAIRDQMAKAMGGDALMQAVQKDPTVCARMSDEAKGGACDATVLFNHGISTGPDQGAHETQQTITGETVQGWVNDAKNVQGDLNNQSEMNMIQLQSLMSDRQTSVQMCTNLVQSLGDQANKIAANVGH